MSVYLRPLSIGVALALAMVSPADELNQAILGIEAARERLKTASFSATFTLDQNPDPKGGATLMGMKPEGWRFVYPRTETYTMGRSGERAYLHTPDYYHVTQSGTATVRRVLSRSELEGTVWKIEKGPVNEFLPPLADPLDLGYTIYERFMDEAVSRTHFVIDLVRRKVAKLRLRGDGKIELSCVFRSKRIQNEVTAVLAPAWGYLVESESTRQTDLASGWVSKEVRHRVLQAKRLSGGVWLPTQYLLSYPPGAQRVTLDRVDDNVPQGLFEIVPRPGDVRREGGADLQLQKDGTWKPKPTAQELEARAADRQEEGTVREYFLWVLGGILLVVVGGTVPSYLKRRASRPVV